MIGDDGAILTYIESGIVQRRLFAATPDRQHTKTFIDLMNEYPHASLYMLVDILDQSYVKHALPPVTSLGLKKLVARRLDRDFAKEDIKGALNLGREKKGRKDWNFLLISLSAASGLQGWLDIVLDMPNRFAGIYLLPVECEQIIPKLAKHINEPSPGGDEQPKTPSKRRIGLPSGRKKDPLLKSAEPEKTSWQLLVSHHKVGGFRQVVLKDGHLIFTRITQGAEAPSPAITAGNVEQEVLNTIEYLKRLSLTDSSLLDIYFIVAQEIKNNLSRDRIPCNQAYIFTPYEAAELFNLKQAVLSADRYGDMVLAGAFAAEKKHRLKLNPTYAEKLDKLYQAMLGLKSVTALGCLLAVYFIFLDVLTIPGQIIDTQKARDQEVARQAELAELQQSMSGVTANADQISDLITAYEFFSKDTLDVMEPIGQASQLISENRLLKTFAWKAENLLGDDDTKKPLVTIELEMNVVFSNAQLKVVAKETEDYFLLVKDTFANYEMAANQSTQGNNDSRLEFSLEDIEKRQKENDLTSELIK
ncbi:MAG: hypothetical protein K2Q12_05045, partial [Rickettsiales bacterium]|nr:hypothetical protein [Rickettsiales bacterium]